jgi:hypothetical protein
MTLFDLCVVHSSQGYATAQTFSRWLLTAVVQVYRTYFMWDLWCIKCNFSENFFTLPFIIPCMFYVHLSSEADAVGS